MPAWLSNRADTRKCRLFLCLETARNLVVQFLGAANPSEYSQRARAGEANQTRGDHDGPPLELGHMIALQIEEQLRTARNVGCLNPPRPNVWRTPEKQFKPSTARDGANDVKRFCSRRDLLGQRSVRRRVRCNLGYCLSRALRIAPRVPSPPTSSVPSPLTPARVRKCAGITTRIMAMFGPPLKVPQEDLEQSAPRCRRRRPTHRPALQLCQSTRHTKQASREPSHRAAR